MSVIEYIIGALLLAMAVGLIVLIMFQQSTRNGLSSALSGSGDTYYGKNKGKSKQKLLMKATAIVAIVFALLVLALYVCQDIDIGGNNNSSAASQTSSAASTSSTGSTASLESAASAESTVSEESIVSEPEESASAAASSQAE